MERAAQVRAFRDLLIMDCPGPIVLACDSVGGIGPLPNDSVAAEARTTAHFATRVPLLEVVCAGARPVAVIDTLSIAGDETGQEMIDAVRSLAMEAGVQPEAVSGSTEDNVPTSSTGIGVVVVGQLRDSRTPAAQPGDVVLCVGLPRSAPHDKLFPGHPDIVPIPEIQAALATGLVNDALPVGSKGLAWEVPQLATTAGLDVSWETASGVDAHASGGPSSCVLLSCAPEAVAELSAVFSSQTPVTRVAWLEAGR